MYNLRGCGRAGAFDANLGAWEWFLDTAHFYGWRPEGTQHTGVLAEIHGEEDYEPPGGDAGYFTNSYQRVTDSDAASIADALERALENKTSDPLRQCSEECLDYLREFAAFCRAGSFFIG